MTRASQSRSDRKDGQSSPCAFVYPATPSKLRSFSTCIHECLASIAESKLRRVSSVSSLTREQAIELGSQRRAKAFIDLADATPQRDTPTGLLERGAKAAGLAPRASARAAERAAATVRRSHAGPVKRGKTTSAEERAIATAILKALVAAKVEEPRCDAVATRPGRPAKLRIEIPIEATRELARALAKAKARG